MSDESATLIVLLFVCLIVFVIFRGFVGLCQRYNAILVIFYFAFLFPIACVHAYLLGVFGASKEEMLEQEAREEMEKQARMQEIWEREVREREHWDRERW